MVYCCNCGVVCLCAYLLDTTVSPGKMDKPVGVPFGVGTRRGLSNHVLGRDPDSPGEEAVLEEQCGFMLALLWQLAYLCCLSDHITIPEGE